MNKVVVILFFIFSFQSQAQQPEYFNFTDTAFKIHAVKRIPYMWHLCGHGINENEKIIMDSVAAFLKAHNTILLELGVHYSTAKYDRGEAEYFKSLLVKRGADPSQITIAGYGGKYPIYSKKKIKKVRKKVRKEFKNPEKSKEWYEMYELLDQTNTENMRIELKILQL